MKRRQNTPLAAVVGVGHAQQQAPLIAAMRPVLVAEFEDWAPPNQIGPASVIAAPASSTNRPGPRAVPARAARSLAVASIRPCRAGRSSRPAVAAVNQQSAVPRPVAVCSGIRGGPSGSGRWSPGRKPQCQASVNTRQRPSGTPAGHAITQGKDPPLSCRSPSRPSAAILIRIGKQPALHRRTGPGP